jgi:hypothetical protein
MTSEYRIPAPLQNTIDNLAFLASTDDGEKLFFKERMHINKTDWSARVRRYYYNETLESQKKIIKEIIDLGLDSLKSYKDNVHYKRLVEGFSKAKDGLCNLRNTYLKEGREVQDLDNYIYVMENQITALKGKTKKVSEVDLNASQNFHFTTPHYQNEDENYEISNSYQSNNSVIINPDYDMSELTQNDMIDTSNNSHGEIPVERNEENTVERNGENGENMENGVIPSRAISSVLSGSPNIKRRFRKNGGNTNAIPIRTRPELHNYMNRSKNMEDE